MTNGSATGKESPKYEKWHVSAREYFKQWASSVANQYDPRYQNLVYRALWVIGAGYFVYLLVREYTRDPDDLSEYDEELEK